jgi:hypothetical protein
MLSGLIHHERSTMTTTTITTCVDGDQPKLTAGDAMAALGDVNII